MVAENSLREGKLKEALEELQEQVRNDPSNAKYRVFLFQLLSVDGQWDRALNQLQVAGEMDAGNLAMVQTYREAVNCEVLRAEIFAGKRSPLVFGEPEKWIALMFEALRLGAEGKHAESQQLRDEAFEDAPPTSGTIVIGKAQVPGEPEAPAETEEHRFEWLADADTRMGPLLEVVVNGRYYWIPFHRIHKIEIETPADLRDKVWTPALFTWSNGGEAVGLVPTRYAGSDASEDSQIQLAAKTAWNEVQSDVYEGVGQRLLTSDVGDFALMDVRSVTLDTLEDGVAEAGAEEGAAEEGPADA